MYIELNNFTTNTKSHNLTDIKVHLDNVIDELVVDPTQSEADYDGIDPDSHVVVSITNCLILTTEATGFHSYFISITYI